jgi:DNA-binding NarL/FixJ family response regulator
MSSEPVLLKNIKSQMRELNPSARAGAAGMTESWHAGRNLSPHEIRLLLLLANGHNLKTAATALQVSRATVAWHMRNLYEKLQAHSKSEAVAKALRSGIIH